MRVRMADVRRHLGIARGGECALTAVALLTGGDYNQGGAEGVGQKQVGASLLLLPGRGGPRGAFKRGKGVTRYESAEDFCEGYEGHAETLSMFARHCPLPYCFHLRLGD